MTFVALEAVEGVGKNRGEMKKPGLWAGRLSQEEKNGRNQNSPAHDDNVPEEVGQQQQKQVFVPFMMT